MTAQEIQFISFITLSAVIYVMYVELHVAGDFAIQTPFLCIPMTLLTLQRVCIQTEMLLTGAMHSAYSITG